MQVLAVGSLFKPIIGLLVASNVSDKMGLSSLASLESLAKKLESLYTTPQGRQEVNAVIVKRAKDALLPSMRSAFREDRTANYANDVAEDAAFDELVRASWEDDSKREVFVIDEVMHTIVQGAKNAHESFVRNLTRTCILQVCRFVCACRQLCLRFYGFLHMAYMYMCM